MSKITKEFLISDILPVIKSNQVLAEEYFQQIRTEKIKELNLPYKNANGGIYFWFKSPYELTSFFVEVLNQNGDFYTEVPKDHITKKAFLEAQEELYTKFCNFEKQLINNNKELKKVLNHQVKLHNKVDNAQKESSYQFCSYVDNYLDSAEEIEAELFDNNLLWDSLVDDYISISMCVDD